MIWNDYSANENATRIVTRFVERDAGDPLSVWSSPKDAFPDEPADGIYHGAAMSAVADGKSVHVVYKDQNQMRLWYRRFDAAAVDEIGNSGTTTPVRVAVRNGGRAGGCASAHAEQPLMEIAAALCAMLRRRRLS